MPDQGRTNLKLRIEVFQRPKLATLSDDGKSFEGMIEGLCNRCRGLDPRNTSYHKSLIEGLSIQRVLWRCSKPANKHLNLRLRISSPEAFNPSSETLEDAPSPRNPAEELSRVSTSCPLFDLFLHIFSTRSHGRPTGVSASLSRPRHRVPAYTMEVCPHPGCIPAQSNDPD